MRIPLALIADFALAHQTDNKLYVTGGGIRGLAFPLFPATQPRLALALGIEVSDTELDAPHSMTIEATGPSGEAIMKAVAVTFTVTHRADQGESGYVHFVSNIENIVFPSEGEYTFVIDIDGVKLERLPVSVSRSVGEIPEGMEAMALLAQGYTAFGEGQLDAAETIFRDVVARFPAVAGGHNNLGFVLLAKGRAAEALSAFDRARDLGYPQNEISDANVACARYVSGDALAALGIFIDCLRSHVFRTPATLFAIGPEGLFPMLIQSAAEYGALMELNAAWCAKRSGDQRAAAHYLEGARSAELSLRSDPGAKLFVESVHALQAESA